MPNHVHGSTATHFPSGCFDNLEAEKHSDSPDAAMHTAFALAAQYIMLAYALQLSLASDSEGSCSRGTHSAVRSARFYPSLDRLSD